ncbi:hypothetical protein ACQ5JZ_21190 [Streptomyces sp. ZG43]|uniref:hypothetical protein n=1 Tax=Streptomyces TaxID=1883 RepID=UPI0002F27250|nr:hypothetical protein [Streptomyces sp. GBA 94-10 4N24]RPK68606.1 hypothetical protein EES44_08475 [Streptomyces sp. ADI96-15]
MGTPGSVGGTLHHEVAVCGRDLMMAVEPRGRLPERERGWRSLFADRHPFARGPVHRAACPEDGRGFEVELVVGEEGPGTVTGAGPGAGAPS